MYYKHIDTGNLVHKESADKLIKLGKLPYDKSKLVEVSEVEINEILNPPPTTEQLQQQAKVTRDAAISANLAALDCEWQVLNDAEDIRKVIGDAETVSALDTDIEMFRLANNTWRETTIAELRQVLAAHVARKRSIWSQFGAWDNGTKDSPFTIE